MDTTDIPRAGEPPLAKIQGIQFGLLTSADICKLSVYPEDKSQLKKKKQKHLGDPQLGLPTPTGECATCLGKDVDNCQGHFAHCLLPLPIFHPNHVGKLVALLRKICLNCGQPKKKKLGKSSRSLLAPTLKKQLEQNASARLPRRAPQSPVVDEVDDDEDDYQMSSKHKRKYAEAFIDVEARADRETPEASDSVILLSSSDDEDVLTSARKHAKGQRQLDEEDDMEKACSSTVPAPPRRSWNLRKRKSPTDSNENPTTEPGVIDLTNAVWNPLSVANGGKRQKTKKGKGSQPSIEVVEVLATPVDEDSEPSCGPCKYCSDNSAQYPEVLLKVEVKERAKDENLSKAIKMEYKVKQKDIESVAPDYWNFVEHSRRHQIPVKRSRLLLPSEALRIVAKIPKPALKGLGMHPQVAQPEALIVECVPVPPNCTTIQDDTFGNTNIGFSQGLDRATQSFSKLVNKANSIQSSRFGNPTFTAASTEASELQSLFGLYLREKGASKAVPGKEKKRIDHVGRVQKRDSRWSLEWLKRHVLGKRGGHSARNVLTGDPFLKVEEIGIPQLFAKNVTIPERVNRLNKDKLQECVNVGQQLTGRYRACGAVRLLRGSEQLEVTRKTSHDLQIGDIVHRHLKDGDLVYVNRPPSLHKHSLLALRVHVQDMPVFTINPAICAPLHADFDGDCLHVFVPQSEETKAELHQLMSIPQQILPTRDGKTIIGMSQDNILATHLLTSTPVFLKKEAMHQMAMWSTRKLPVPAIVKSLKGPRWTGKQVIDLTIPEDFSFTSEDDAVDIQNGELMSNGRKENWLTSTSGLMRALAQHSPQAAVHHLDCSQAALREWILSRGFSVSLQDFYVAADHKLRRKMVEELKASISHAAGMTTRMELIFCGEYQKLDAIQSCMDMVSKCDPKQAEDMAVGYFQQQFSEIGEEMGLSVSGDNQLLAMVRSGSKGSLAKVFQQIGCLGLQLYKGEHLLSLAGNRKLESVATSMSCEGSWEAQGLVKSSLLDGLDPLEFYLHSIAVRAGLLRQSLEVTEPGELFKNLMLFLRDVHVSYDGTVRNKCGLEIIQFMYDGVNAPNSTENTSEREESVMPGEAVGILAATAIAQPAYQVMLEANHNVGSKKIRPLALLQDTIFPRSGTKLKASDRRTVLRLKPCHCQSNHCDERRALRLKSELQPVSVDMVAVAMSIEYVPENSLEWTACQADGVKLRLPWIGHIQFDKNAMIQSNLSMERVVSIMETAFKSNSYAKVLASNYVGNPVFFYRNVCDCMRASGNSRELGPCLHFSATLKSRTSKRMANRSDKRVLEFVDGLRDVIAPLILKTTVKGDERVESAKIIWEDAAWSPSKVSYDGERTPANPNGELVVEVIVQEKLSTSRGSPWNIMKEACALIDIIDWQRSAPYSVQEVRHSLGVEAARDCILQRLTLATQAAGPSSVSRTHLKLVSDLMVHSGEVNGITSSGYRDLLRSLKTSAPFTAGAFRAPIKTFMEAAEKGDEEFLSGVLASSIFGKRVPVGTGADFSLQLQPKVVSAALQPMQSTDILDCLANLNSKIKAEFPETPVASEAEVHINHDMCEEADKDAWGQAGTANATETEEGAWGSNADGGDWASENVGLSQGEGMVIETSNGWDSIPPSKDAEVGGWGGVDLVESLNTDGGDWAMKSPSDNADAGGWGADTSTDGRDEEISVKPSVESVAADGVQCSTASVEEMNGWDPVVMHNEPDSEGGWGVEPTEDAVRSGGLDNTSEDIGQAESDLWGSHDSGKLSDRSRMEPSSHPSRRDEPREFRPTGANNIPLGKMRQFGVKIADSGSEGVEGCHSLVEGTPVWDGKGSDSGWTVTSVQEGGTEPLWGMDFNQDAHLGSGPVDVQARASALSSPAGHTNAGWSPKVAQTIEAGHHGQNDGGRGLSNSGGSTLRREQTRRVLDSRKDSKDWEELIDTVRAVRNILQSYESEQRLTDADCHTIMTQVLPHHPSSAAKVGCGVDFIKVATYQVTRTNDRPSKCLFVVRTDGTQDDFSYHKCLQTLASKKNPPLDDLYATAFISRKAFDLSAR